MLSQANRLNSVALFVILISVVGITQAWAISVPDGSAQRDWRTYCKEKLEKGEYEQGIVFCRGLLVSPGTADRDKLQILRYLTILYWYSDRSQEAAQSCRDALAIAASSGLKNESASIESELALQKLYVQAIELRNGGDLRGSNERFEKARQDSATLGSRAYEVKILRTWSSNYSGSPTTLKTCVELNLQALTLALSLNYKAEAGRAAYNIGVYYSIQNDFSHALGFYLRALDFIRDVEAPTETIICLNNLSTAYIALGDYAKARDYLTEALRLIGAGPAGPVESSLLINLGQTLLSLARSLQTPEYYDQALECFNSYLNLKKKAGGRDIDLHALNGIAAIYVDQGRLEEARAALLPAVEKLKTDKTSALSGMTLLNLAAIALKSGQAAAAERHYNLALAAAKQNNEYLQLIRASYGLGRCSELRGKDDQAIASYQEAIRIVTSKGSSIVSDADRAEFIGRSRDPYQALIELYYRLSGKGRLSAFVREIYRVAESCRARSFLEQLEKQAGQTSSGQPGTTSSEDRLSGERLSLLRQLSRDARNMNQSQIEDLQSRIRHLDDMLDASIFDKELQNGASPAAALPVSLNVLQRSVLQDRTALLEYVLGDGRSFLLCVSKQDFHLVELPPARSIEDSLVAYLRFLEDPSIPADKGLPAARRLYAELVQPAAGFIPNNVQRLVIVPDGILFRLPFESLVLEAVGSSPATYLNDRYIISYSPSASSLSYLKQAPKKPHQKEALAFGISEYGSSGRRSQAEDVASASSVLNDLYKRNGFTIGPIPYSRTEIDGLARRIRRPGIDVYFGEKATEAAFKRLDLGAYRLIHLACHAFSDDRYPLRSSLVFSAGGDEEDGFLQVSEMYRMRTKADLVVLSACQTGRGKVVRNEGILGLPRIFFYMGAHSVISTLWPIHDKAGALFMGYFYDSYYRGAGKAESLQAAKKKMSGTKYSHPFYWAAYTLTGEF